MLRAYRKYRQRVGAALHARVPERRLRPQPGASREARRALRAAVRPAPADGRRRAEEALRQEILAPTSTRSRRSTTTASCAATSARRRHRAHERVPGPGGATCRSSSLSAAVPGMPKPQPLYEIFVYSPEMEGIHLRGGRVARGGIRWSDRLEDYRTEILGLMKAQMVKNAVIVPVGSKGGFVLKHPPADRQALRDEVVAQYIDADAGHARPHRQPRRRRGRPSRRRARPRRRATRTWWWRPTRAPPTLSDTANAVTAEYGFWLGDAFASGGSAGYDHKALGITARGAWESVKRHFRELGLDVDDRAVHRGRRRRHVGRRVRQRHAAVGADPAGGRVRPPPRLHRPRPRPGRRRSPSGERLFDLPRLVVGRLRPHADLAPAAASGRATRRASVPLVARRRAPRSAIEAERAARRPS